MHQFFGHQTYPKVTDPACFPLLTAKAQDPVAPTPIGWRSTHVLAEPLHRLA